MTKEITDQLSTTTCPLKIYRDDNCIAIGTSFICEYGNINYLITAGHNITGTHPETNENFGIPNKIGILMHRMNEHNQYVGCKECSVELQCDGKDVWLVHPQYGLQVDVVAIRLRPSEMKTHPINLMPFDDEHSIVAVGMDVFILGYPHGYISYPTILPIWKRGTLATEPAIDIDRLPKMYVDTTTAKGMSGSPVIAQFNGAYMPQGKLSDDSFFGVARQFLGIYTGRCTDTVTEDLRDSIFNAQLGIVWKKIVIGEIILQDQEI